MVFTSPSPFGYGDKGIGHEEYPYEYVENLFELFDQVYRVLKPTGCVWLEMSDYHNPNTGTLTAIPEELLTRMASDCWYLRSKCLWVRTEKFEIQEDYNRFARDWEYLYFFAINKDHYFNNPRNKIQSSVCYADYKSPWGNNFESGFAEKIIERCINLSCPKNGTVL